MRRRGRTPTRRRHMGAPPGGSGPRTLLGTAVLALLVPTALFVTSYPVLSVATAAAVAGLASLAVVTRRARRVVGEFRRSGCVRFCLPLPLTDLHVELSNAPERR